PTLVPYTTLFRSKVREEVQLGEEDATALLSARGSALDAVLCAADALRREVCGDTVTYVVTRNVNYTNVCYFRCGFCAFSKGRLAKNLRGAPYLVPVDEIARRAEEAWERGAVEICLQGGIHPAFTGDTYVEICKAVKRAVPPRPASRPAAPERRLHRARPAPVRAHGGADLPPRPRPPRADFSRGAARPRRGPPRAAPMDHERPGLVGEARTRRGARGPRG